MRRVRRQGASLFAVKGGIAGRSLQGWKMQVEHRHDFRIMSLRESFNFRAIKEKLIPFYYSYLDVLDFILRSLIPAERINKEVAFIRMDLLGDFIVFFPFFLEYKARFGRNSIFVVQDFLKEIYRNFDVNVIGVNQKKFRYNPIYRYKIFKEILGFNVSAAINLVPHRSPREGDELLYSIKATKKICYEGDYAAKFLKNERISFDFPVVFKSQRANSYEHIFIHEKNMAESIIQDIMAKDIKRFYNNAFRDFKDILSTIPFKNAGEHYAVIVTDGSAKSRIYSRENWQFIMDHLPRNLKIIQVGKRSLKLEHKNLLDLTNKTKLLEAIKIVQNARIVIGNETGLTHLAYLTGIPTVCILGGGHFGRFLPWKEFEDIVKCVYKYMECFRCRWVCQYVDLLRKEVPPCISQIRPESVIYAVEELNQVYKMF